MGEILPIYVLVALQPGVRKSTAVPSQTHWGLLEAALAQASFGLFRSTTVCIMNAKRLICFSWSQAPEAVHGSRALLASSTSSPDQPVVCKCVRLLLFCQVNSSRQEKRGFSPNPILQKALPCLTSFNLCVLPQAALSTTFCSSVMRMFQTCYSDPGLLD